MEFIARAHFSGNGRNFMIWSVTISAFKWSCLERTESKILSQNSPLLESHMRRFLSWQPSCPDLENINCFSFYTFLFSKYFLVRLWPCRCKSCHICLKPGTFLKYYLRSYKPNYSMESQAKQSNDGTLIYFWQCLCYSARNPPLESTSELEKRQRSLAGSIRINFIPRQPA
jgi:hypothetical protein